MGDKHKTWEKDKQTEGERERLNPNVFQEKSKTADSENPIFKLLNCISVSNFSREKKTTEHFVSKLNFLLQFKF